MSTKYSAALAIIDDAYLGALRFAPNPLGNLHPQLRLVADRLRRRDVFRRFDLFRGQAKRDRRLGAGVTVADLAFERRKQLRLSGLGQPIPYACDRVSLEILRGFLVGGKLREGGLCGRKFFLHLDPPTCGDQEARSRRGGRTLRCPFRIPPQPPPNQALPATDRSLFTHHGAPPKHPRCPP